jgi:hypothetical protein
MICTIWRERLIEPEVLDRAKNPVDLPRLPQDSSRTSFITGMRTPTCSNCGKTIPADDVNVARDVAFCRSCNLAYPLSDLASGLALDHKIDLHQPPQGCWHRPTGMGAVVGASHRSLLMALPLLGVALFWNGIVSVFVSLALASTLHLLGAPVPEWFPAPRMNDETMGVGMTIFLWIFLTPFIVIGLGMIGAFLSCIAGKTEVRVDRGVVAIATGIGPVSWNRRFQAADLKEIRMEESVSNSNDSGPKKQIVAELMSGKTIKFGSMLRDERRRFLAAAAEKIIRGEGSVAPLHQAR